MPLDLKPGDLIEIPLQGCLAYAQITHEHPSYPPVVRVLAGRPKQRPSDLPQLAQTPSDFKAMLPIGPALIRLGIEALNLGSYPIPAADRDFPLFRMPIRDRMGALLYWWYWDGSTLSLDADLGRHSDALQLPLREVMTSETFMSRLQPPV